MASKKNLLSGELPSSAPEHPGFLEALKVWFKIGLLSFGGPTGQIGLMHREVVERRRWVSDNRFLQALNYCMLLPGPEAQQLAIYLGWLLHRVRGGIAAGLMFVLPGAFLMWLISCIYVIYGDVPLINAIFYGLKPAVIAIVIAALLRIGKKALKNQVMWGVSALAFIGIFVFSVPFPAIILGAGLIGWMGGWRWPNYFDISGGHSGGAAAAGESGFVICDAISEKIGTPTIGRSLRSALVWSAIWLAPVLLCLLVFGGSHVLTQEGIFFSKASLVTFGGAYAVLPYVAQQAVETHEWLSATQMMDGLGLAETTPGPLVLVLQFVGFLGGFNSASEMSPILVATLGAAMTSWVTFVPGFLFIFVGGPFVESSRGNLSMNTALSAVTAAVVGVILNLAVWFGWHVVLPEPGKFDYFSIAAIILFFIALQRFKWDILWVIGLGAISGVVWHAIIGL
jgi:chromate transporter